MCQFTKKLSLITVFAFLHSEVITHQALWQHIFLIGIHYMLDWTATARHGVKEKEAQKDQIIQEICLERIYSEKLSVNSRLQGIINAQKLIFHAKHKFCIILNNSSSPNLVLKSHKICSEENRKKSRHNKNAFFHWHFFWFYRQWSYMKIFVVTQPPMKLLYIRLQKEQLLKWVANRKSSH